MNQNYYKLFCISIKGIEVNLIIIEKFGNKKKVLFSNDKIKIPNFLKKTN